MRPHAPSSRAYFRIRISVLDASFAVLSPILALVLRDAPVLSDGSYSLYFYWAFCAIFSLISFSIFRLEHKGVRYFSVDDIFDIVKAVVVAELLTATALFSFTRLDGIPRSTLFIHALILAAALIAARTMAHLFEYERKRFHTRPIKATSMPLSLLPTIFPLRSSNGWRPMILNPNRLSQSSMISEEMVGRKNLRASQFSAVR